MPAPSLTRAPVPFRAPVMVSTAAPLVTLTVFGAALPSVRAFGAVAVAPVYDRAAPLSVTPAVLRLVAKLDTDRVPAFSVMFPVYDVLVPDSVMMPVLVTSLMSDPVPVR